MFKFKKSELTDVLWLMALLLIFCIVFIFETQFTSTQTIDTYAKDIVNREVTRFATNSNGFSSIEAKSNMYFIGGDGRPAKRAYGVSGDLPQGSDATSAISSAQAAASSNEDGASAVGIVKFNLEEMKYRIETCFGANSSKSGSYTDADLDVNSSLEENTRSVDSISNNLQDKDISISFTETENTTLVTVTVKYDVLYTNYTGKHNGIFQKQQNQAIHRSVVITRNIENVSRYQDYV